MTDTDRPGGTYRTPDEQREILGPAEERFERSGETGLTQGDGAGD